MGSGSSIQKIYSCTSFPSPQFHQNCSEYQHYYDSLHLTHEDLFKLYQIFQKLDHLNKGWIPYETLIKFLNLNDSQFIYKIFTIFDYSNSSISASSSAPAPTPTHPTLQQSTSLPSSSSSSSSLSLPHTHHPASRSPNFLPPTPPPPPNSSGSGVIYFYQFVISCWSICTLYQKDYTLYLFNLYDLDESGFLDSKITQQIIEDIYGTNFKADMEAQRAYEQLGSLPNKSIDPYTFQRYGGGNPRMLFQVFSIQSLIRKGIVGEDFWEEQSMRRAQLNPGIHVSVHSLLGHSRRGKLRCSARIYSDHTSSIAGAHQSSEDFKVPRHLDTEVTSVKGQVSNSHSLLSQPLFEMRRESFQPIPRRIETPEIFEMETLP